MESGFHYEYNPVKAGLNRFVNKDNIFPGKVDLQAQVAAGSRRYSVMLEIDNGDTPAPTGEGVFTADGTPVVQ